MQLLERFGTVSITDTIDAIEKFNESISALSFIEKERAKTKKRVPFFGQNVRLGSLRLQTFLNYGVICSTCKKEADFFAIERHKENTSYHINLYSKGADGNDLLFTHDHILARSLGGADKIENTQTMCTECNSIKSIGERKLLDERKGINKNNNVCA